MIEKSSGQERTGSLFSAALSTSAVIDAPAAEVWRLLTDLPGYRDWNPYFLDGEGEVTEGGTVTLQAVLPDGRANTSSCSVIRVRPEQELRWTSSFGVPGLLKSDHRFQLVAEGPGSTRLQQDETFAGLLVPLMGGTIRQIREGCTAMAQALKDRLES